MLVGVDLESTPFVVAAVVASVALGALALGVRARWVLWAVVVFALGFAIADVRELVKQLDESRAGIAEIVAGVIALHAVAVVAAMLGTRPIAVTTERRSLAA